MKRIIVATKNKGKMKEIREILSDLEYEILSLEDIGLDVDVVEDGNTFQENATKKAVEIMKICNEITLADDSGLSVDALNGAPGIYSARYSGEHGDDLQNNLLLLENMKNQKNRNAKFICSIALAFPDGKIINVDGEFYGQIDYEMKGQGGFGYDVLFYLPEYDKTSAEISAEEKNKISHRFKALNKLKEELINMEGWYNV